METETLNRFSFLSNWGGALPSTFLTDLRTDAAMLLRQCPAIALIWRRAGFDPERDLRSLADTVHLPPILSASFKRSAHHYLKLLRRPADTIDAFTLSSSTSGDPSVIGRTRADIAGYAAAFQRGFEACHGAASFDRVLALWPDPVTLLSSANGQISNRPAEPFAAHVFKIAGSVREASRHVHLLRLQPGAPAQIDVDGLAAGLDLAQDGGERLLICAPPIVIHLAFTRLTEKFGRRWSLGQNAFLLVGAGGWDGRKGTMDLGHGIARQSFVAQTVDLLGIPPDHISDHYGFSESGLSFPGLFDGDDFTYAVPPEAHVILRDPITLEPFTEAGREGLIEVISPYVNSSHAAIALMVDDLASFVAGSNNRRLRIHGRAPSSHKSGCGAMLQ